MTSATQRAVAGTAGAAERRRGDRPGDAVLAGGDHRHGVPRRQPQRARRPDRPRVVPGARDRSRHHHAVGRRDRGSARRSRRGAEGRDQPPRAHALVHLPVGGLPRRPGGGRRRGAQSGVSRRTRSRSAAPKRSPRSARTRTIRASAPPRRCKALLYGRAHPYGRPAKGSVETRRALRAATHLLAYHAAQVRAGVDVRGDRRRRARRRGDRAGGGARSTAGTRRPIRNGRCRRCRARRRASR